MQTVNLERCKDGVNLALGGGGAKGFVHLGVIEELAELGIPIKAIVGTSIGAIIGSLFAHFSTSLCQSAKNPQLAAAQAVTDLFLRENFLQYRDASIFSGLQQGLLKGDKISAWLAEKLYDESRLSPIRFGALEFPLTITATDAHTGECLVMKAPEENSMFVHQAVRASMSIQWVFREINLQVGGKEHRCWDGGTTGNCRFDIANRVYRGRPTIASSLTYRGEIVETHSSYFGTFGRPYKVLNHSTSIMMRAAEQALKEAMPDCERKNTIFLAPRLDYSAGRVGTLDFNLARDYREELVHNGKHAVRENLCRC